MSLDLDKLPSNLNILFINKNENKAVAEALLEKIKSKQKTIIDNYENYYDILLINNKLEFKNKINLIINFNKTIDIPSLCLFNILNDELIQNNCQIIYVNDHLNEDTVAKSSTVSKDVETEKSTPNVGVNIINLDNLTITTLKDFIEKYNKILKLSEANTNINNVAFIHIIEYITLIVTKILIINRAIEQIIKLNQSQSQEQPQDLETQRTNNTLMTIFDNTLIEFIDIANKIQFKELSEHPFKNIINQFIILRDIFNIDNNNNSNNRNKIFDLAQSEKYTATIKEIKKYNDYGTIKIIKAYIQELVEEIITKLLIGNSLAENADITNLIPIFKTIKENSLNNTLDYFKSNNLGYFTNLFTKLKIPTIDNENILNLIKKYYYLNDQDLYFNIISNAAILNNNIVKNLKLLAFENDKLSVNTSVKDMNELLEKCQNTIKDFSFKSIIYYTYDDDKHHKTKLIKNSSDGQIVLSKNNDELRSLKYIDELFQNTFMKDNLINIDVNDQTSIDKRLTLFTQYLLCKQDNIGKQVIINIIFKCLEELLELNLQLQETTIEDYIKVISKKINELNEKVVNTESTLLTDGDGIEWLKRTKITDNSAISILDFFKGKPLNKNSNTELTEIYGDNYKKLGKDEYLYVHILKKYKEYVDTTSTTNLDKLKSKDENSLLKKLKDISPNGDIIGHMNKIINYSDIFNYLQLIHKTQQTNIKSKDTNNELYNKYKEYFTILLNFNTETEKNPTNKLLINKYILLYNIHLLSLLNGNLLIEDDKSYYKFKYPTPTNLIKTDMEYSFPIKLFETIKGNLSIVTKIANDDIIKGFSEEKRNFVLNAFEDYKKYVTKYNNYKFYNVYQKYIVPTYYILNENDLNINIDENKNLKIINNQLSEFDSDIDYIKYIYINLYNQHIKKNLTSNDSNDSNELKLIESFSKIDSKNITKTKPVNKTIQQFVDKCKDIINILNEFIKKESNNLINDSDSIYEKLIMVLLIFNKTPFNNQEKLNTLYNFLINLNYNSYKESIKSQDNSSNLIKDIINLYNNIKLPDETPQPVTDVYRDKQKIDLYLEISDKNVNEIIDIFAENKIKENGYELSGIVPELINSFLEKRKLSKYTFYVNNFKLNNEEIRSFINGINNLFAATPSVAAVTPPAAEVTQGVNDSNFNNMEGGSIIYPINDDYQIIPNNYGVSIKKGLINSLKNFFYGGNNGNANLLIDQNQNQNVNIDLLSVNNDHLNLESVNNDIIIENNILYNDEKQKGGGFLDVFKNLGKIIHNRNVPDKNDNITEKIINEKVLGLKNVYDKEIYDKNKNIFKLTDDEKFIFNNNYNILLSIKRLENDKTGLKNLLINNIPPITIEENVKRLSQPIKNINESILNIEKSLFILSNYDINTKLFIGDNSLQSGGNNNNYILVGGTGNDFLKSIRSNSDFIDKINNNLRQKTGTKSLEILQKTKNLSSNKSEKKEKEKDKGQDKGQVMTSYIPREVYKPPSVIPPIVRNELFELEALEKEKGDKMDQIRKNRLKDLRDYKNLLEKHYNGDTIDFEELQNLENKINPLFKKTEVEHIVDINDRSRLDTLQLDSKLKKLDINQEIKINNIRNKEFKRENTLQGYIKLLENFYIEMSLKNKKWLDDLNTAIKKITRDIDDMFTTIHTQNLQPGVGPRTKKQIVLLYRKLFNTINSKIYKNYIENKKFFFKENRHKFGELKKYINKNIHFATNEYKQKLLLKYNQNDKYNIEKVNFILDSYKNISKNYEILMKKIEQNNNDFYIGISNIIRNNIHLYGVGEKYKSEEKQEGGELKNEEYIESEYRGIQFGAGGVTNNGIMDLDDDDKIDIENKYEKLLLNVAETRNKLKSYYILNWQIMSDIILDKQFIVLYVIKALRIFFTYIALFLTTRVFTPIYEELVYDKKKPAPKLWKYLLIFTGFDISFNVFLIILLFLLQFLFKTDDNTFVVDKYLMNKYLIDYSISLVLIIFIGLMISSVVMDKKYFQFKYQGSRAIRAFESMMFYTAIVINIFPYFLI